MHMSGGWLLWSGIFFTLCKSIIQAYFKTYITFWHLPPANSVFCYRNGGRKVIFTTLKKTLQGSRTIVSWQEIENDLKMYLRCLVIWDGFVLSAPPFCPYLSLFQITPFVSFSRAGYTFFSILLLSSCLYRPWSVKSESPFTSNWIK